MTNIKATNIELTDAIKDHIEKRVSHVLKFAGDEEVQRIFVEVGKTTNHHKQGDVFRAEMDVTIGGKKYYTVSQKSDLYTAIDDAEKELVSELTGKKGRARALFRRGAQKMKDLMRSIPPFNRKS